MVIFQMERRVQARSHQESQPGPARSNEAERRRCLLTQRQRGPVSWLPHPQMW